MYTMSIVTINKGGQYIKLHILQTRLQLNLFFIQYTKTYLWVVVTLFWQAINLGLDTVSWEGNTAKTHRLDYWSLIFHRKTLKIKTCQVIFTKITSLFFLVKQISRGLPMGVITSVSKKLRQTTVVYHYCGLS